MDLEGIDLTGDEGKWYCTFESDLSIALCRDLEVANCKVLVLKAGVLCEIKSGSLGILDPTTVMEHRTFASDEVMYLCRSIRHDGLKITLLHLNKTCKSKVLVQSVIYGITSGGILISNVSFFISEAASKSRKFARILYGVQKEIIRERELECVRSDMRSEVYQIISSISKWKLESLENEMESPNGVKTFISKSKNCIESAREIISETKEDILGLFNSQNEQLRSLLNENEILLFQLSNSEGPLEDLKAEISTLKKENLRLSEELSSQLHQLQQKELVFEEENQSLIDRLEHASNASEKHQSSIFSLHHQLQLQQSENKKVG